MSVVQPVHWDLKKKIKHDKHVLMVEATGNNSMPSNNPALDEKG